MGTRVVKVSHTFADDETVTMPDYDDLNKKADKSYIEEKFKPVSERLGNLESSLKAFKDQLSGFNTSLNAKIDKAGLDKALQEILSEEKLYQVRDAIMDLLDEYADNIQKEHQKQFTAIKYEAEAFQRYSGEASSVLSKLLNPVSLSLEELSSKIAGLLVNNPKALVSANTDDKSIINQNSLDDQSSLKKEINIILTNMFNQFTVEKENDISKLKEEIKQLTETVSKINTKSSFKRIYDYIISGFRK